MSVPTSVLRESLLAAELTASAGERRLARQQSLIDELARDGHSTRLAEQLLATLQQSQQEFIAECDRLLRELARRR